MPQNTGATTGKHYSTFQQAFDLRGQQGNIFFTTTDWNFYLQDNFRIHPNLTLYLGLRYEYTTELRRMIKPDPTKNAIGMLLIRATTAAAKGSSNNAKLTAAPC